MKKNMNGGDGLQRLIDKLRKEFRIPENVNFYSDEDFLAAERKFLKYALLNGDALVTGPAEGAYSDI